MPKILKSLLTEYGLKWTINRSLVSAKLKMMNMMSPTEKLFEKKVNVKRIDIFDLDVSVIQNFLKELPQKDRSEVISVADKAINGILTAFSSVELKYGKPINWHYSPLTNMESKRDVKWYSIPDFDSELGDIKVVWEASRLTQFFYFARAFLITGDKKYYNAFSEQLEDWLLKNPYPFGANYKCGQECTLRMTNTLIAFTVFEKFGFVTEKDKKNVIKMVEVCYKKVLSNFFYAHRCMKNNHTFSEILGLIIGAWCCDDEVGVKKAYELLDVEIRNQFESDGGFTQHSFNYHRFTLQIIECVYKISEKTGVKITETGRLKNSALLLYQVQNDDGDVPNYGSNDGALIFPVTSCGYRDFRPVINTIYALVEGKRLYENGKYDEELLWFGSNETLSYENINQKASIFSDSGFYTLRHDQGFLMTSLQNFKSRPAHMDQLHIDLWHKGINVLCDSGTYSYASELGKNLSSTIGHNTVKVDGIEQMNKVGAFLVTNWTKRKDVEYTEKRFKGTMISSNGYKHTRAIEKTQKGYLINDDVFVFGDVEYGEFIFHTPCEVRIIEAGVELYEKGRIICTIKTDKDVEVKTSYRSLYYLKKEEINSIYVKCFMPKGKCSMQFDIELSNN
jgi:hypothetical protein